MHAYKIVSYQTDTGTLDFQICKHRNDLGRVYSFHLPDTLSLVWGRQEIQRLRSCPQT